MIRISLLSIITFLGASVSAQCVFSDGPEAQSYLSGGWKLERRCGGITGICETPSQLGYSQELRFTVTGAADSVAYIHYKNSALQSQGRVSLANKPGEGWQMSPIASFVQPRLGLFNCQNDTLMLNEAQVIDGYFYVFSRDQKVGVEDKNITPVRIFPVPATDHIGLNWTRGQAACNVYDLAGNVVLRTAAAAGSRRIDISGLADGYYLLEVLDSGRLFYARFIKQ